MVCIDCNLHGKRVHILSKDGKAEDEYVFITPRAQVFPDTCMNCTDPECFYEFNHKKLLKNKELRKKLIDQVFDATLDDALAKHGLVAVRTVPSIREFEGDFRSKPCYDKKQGEKLKKLDNKIIKTRTKHFKAIDDYIEQITKTKSCKPRILIEREDD